ncbi:MAG: hypothetical protein IT208_17065 [Chthonomonadales bacterium]|nr:hypothetical protein [Chthonomonadales bacterium]
MTRARALLGLLALATLGAPPAAGGTAHRAVGAGPPNPDFETGDLRGWTADANWTVDDNSAGGWYSGWQGRWFAWSGRGGEPRTGRLRSAPFTLDHDGVEVWVAGWADISGRTTDRWNYVSLRLEDGREVDRVYAPNSVAFVPLVLDGSGHRGRKVVLEAVDDGDQSVFSMICIDHVRTVDLRPAPRATWRDPAGSHVLENASCRVEVSRRNGSITRIRDRVGGLELIGEPRLAGSFKLTLPMPGREAWRATEANEVLGSAQRLTSVRRARDSLELTWAGPLRAASGRRYPVSVTMRIALGGEEVRFDLIVRNRSRLPVGEVWYPLIGGMRGLGARARDWERTVLYLPTGAGLASARPFHTFQNMSWLGVIGAEQYYAYPDSLSMPWIDLQAPRLRRGVWFAALDRASRLKVAHLEMSPGLASARPGGNWPRPEELRGLPAGVRACWVHMPYKPAGRDFSASTVVLRFHSGGWREAARLYGVWWRAGHTGPAPEPGDAWQECAPERFDDLPALARGAAAAGVRTLLLVDWKAGGYGDGVPRLEPDAARGGAEGLRAALAACRALGVRVLLRAGLQPVSLHDEWCRRVLAPFVCRDRWGVEPSAFGWGSGSTLWERWGSGERRVWLTLGAPGLRAELAAQARRLATLGVDGLHFDSYFGRTLDFNPLSGSTPDRAAWEGGLAAARDMRSAGDGARPGFTVTFDDVRDGLVAFGGASRAAAAEPSAFREAFPRWRPDVQAASPDALGAVGEALRLGARVRVTLPGGLTLADARCAALAARLRELGAIRAALPASLARGEPLDPAGADVQGGLPVGLWRDPATGRRACVVTNPGASAGSVTVHGLGGGRRAARIYRPGLSARAVALPATLTVEPGGFVVIAEREGAPVPRASTEGAGVH